MEPATAKLSGHEPGPKLTPFASRRENHEGAAADSESIPIRAPLSKDVDDDEEKEGFGTEESEYESVDEEEEAFQITTVESPVGSFTARNPTFLYGRQGSRRRTNGNGSFSVDAMEGVEAAHERGISAEDEAVMEEFVPLVAMVREASSSPSPSPSPSPSSAAAGFSLIRPVAKPSGDDDEQPPEDLENENLGSEEERDSCNVARVPPFAFSGGLHVVGEFGDVGAVEEQGMDDGGFRIVKGSVETVENMEGYGEAMTETSCPELALTKFGDTIEERGRKGSEEAVIGKTADVQNLGPATHVGAFGESEWKEQVGGDRGFQVEEDKFLTNAKKGDLKDSSNEPRVNVSAEIETKVLADAGEGVLDDSNDKQQEAVSAEIETKVHADAKESVLKDSNDNQQEIANAAIGNEILANDAGGVLKYSNDKQQEVASAETKTEALPDAEEGVLDDSNDKQQEAVSAEIETKVHADAKEAVLKDTNDKQKEIANAAIGNEILANDAGGVLKDSNNKQQEVASAEIETEVLADAGEGVLDDSNDKQQEAVGAEIETKIHADAKEAVLKDSNDKQKEIANAAIGNEILSNDAGGVLKDSNDKQQEVASAEIETEVHADTEEGVLKDSNDKQQEVVTPEIETEVLTDAKEGVLKDSTDRQQEIASAEIESDVLVNAKEGVLKDSDDKQQEIASAEIESEVLANAKEGVLKDSNDKQKKTANAAIENEILANGAGGSLNDSNNKQQEVARAEIETEILTDAEGGVLKNSNDKQQEVASPEIKTEVLKDVKEGVLRDSNDGQQKIDCAVIENEVLANAAGGILKDSDNKQQEIAKAEIESDVLVNAKENVLKDSIEKQQEVANAEIESEVHANVKECVLKDSNDMQQQITDAAIENEILSNGVGGVLKDSNNKQQEVASTEIETEVLADAEEGVLKDSNDKQQEVASPEIGTEVLTDAKEGALKDSNDRQQEIASVAIENEVLANAAGGVLKDSNNKQQGIANAEIKSDVLVNAKEGVLNDSNDKQQEIANAEIESEVLVNAKEGDLKDSNDKQQEVAKAEIVDAEKVVDGDTLSVVNSEQDGITQQELAGTQKETRGIEEVKHEGICNKDTVDTNNATDVAAALDNDLAEDGMVEQEVIKNEKEVDDMGKCKADGIQEAKAVNAQGVTKEIPLHESESMREHVAESKQEGTDKDESQLERERMDEEDIVNTAKLQGDGALLDSDSNEDWVTEEDIHDSRKEGLDDKQIEGDDLLEEAKVAHLQSTSKEWILEDSNVKQEGADKGGDSQERRANEMHQTNVAKIQAGKEGASDDFESKQKVISFEERDNTQKTEADDKREAKAAENKTVKGLDFANMTSREGAKFNLESQTCQGSGQLKEGVEFSQREMLGSLKPKKDTESEVPATNADVSEKSTLGKVDRNPEMKTNFSISKDEYMEEKYVVEEEPVATDAKPQFKFESSTGSDQSIQNVVGRMVADWEEEADDDDDEDDDEDEEMMDTSALAALMEAASSAGTVSNNPSVGAAGFSVSTRPAGLGSSVSLLNPIPRYLQHSRTNESAFSRSSALVEDNQDNTDSADGYDETQEKLQTIRVKFLRLVKRLDQSPQNVVVTQVLYRLGLAEGLKRGRSTNRAVSLDRSSKIAEELEAAGQEDLDFTCNILVLGKTGVGKSATINSIFDEVKSATNAFWPATNKVQEILGTIHGIKVRVVDTPGLMPSFADRHRNKAIMSSVKKFIRKCPPDIVLYFDRLDVQSRDYSDLPLLKIITETFGAAIWFNAIVVLTHASSAPPDGANGTPLSYEMFMAQRSQIVQHSIRQAAGDMRLMNPVSLVENHLLCRKNRAGQSVLPNGQVWKPQLLLLCFSSKVLAEANAILKLQDSTPGRPFGFRTRAPPLPFLLSSLLQSRAQLKVPDEQTGEEIDSDEDLEQLSDSDDEDEYDRLPPFKPLSKYRLSKLSKEQRKAYLDEIDYREKLYQKKQWKEELRRRRNIKKTRGTYKVESDRVDENFEEDITGAAAVAVPMPDMAMPPAFDSDNPTYRYRYLETADQWLVRPVLDTHGWDHDIGYDGVNVEKMLVIGNKVPASISGQITKDKKEANLQLECAASLKHGEHKVTQAGFDVQTVGKGLAYTLRSETRFSNFKCNKTTGGLALTYLGDTLVTGMKLEDRIMIGKRSKFVVNGGAMMGGGHLAYGGSLEASLRDKDYPIGQTLTTLGLSVMNWHGDFAIGGNLQSQFGIGRKMMMVTRANLNNKGSGQISIRTSSSEQLQIALIGIIPVIRALIGGRLFGPDSTQ